MKLYHGTCLSNLRGIQTNGIKPRGRRRGNWKEAPSHPEGVYLSDSYAPYFAMAAARKGRGAVIEVDTEKMIASFLLPDEDFLEQASRQFPDFDPPPGLSMLERTAWFRERLWMYWDLWRTSLEMLGTCVYMATIPPAAITRVATFDLKKDPQLMFVFDPTITLLNYKICGESYKGLTAHLFGDPIPEPVTEMGRLRPAHPFPRNAIKVLTLKEPVDA
jgi:hypothetical protein